MNHFHGSKCPVLIQRTPYDKRPDVMGLEFPAAHITGVRTDCSSYVKNMDNKRRKAGTTQASASPKKKRTTNKLAKFWQGNLKQQNASPEYWYVSYSVVARPGKHSPSNEVSCQPFCYRKPLKCPILRSLRQKVSKVEYRG